MAIQLSIILPSLRCTHNWVNTRTFTTELLEGTLRLIALYFMATGLIVLFYPLISMLFVWSHR